MRAHALLSIVGGVVVLAAVFFLFVVDGGGGASSADDAGTRRASGSSSHGLVRAPGSDGGGDGADSVSVDGPGGRASAAPDGATAGAARTTQSFVDRVTDYVAILRAVKAAEAAADAADGDVDEQEEKTRERDAERIRNRLLSGIGRSEELAAALLGEIDALEEADAEHAISLARLLRRADHEALMREMAERVRGSDAPLDRRIALIVLEGKSAEVWLEPVTEAYREDEADSVRDEAAGVLSRSLADNAYFAEREDLRGRVAEGLASDDPKARVRAIRAMLGDRAAGPEEVARLRPFLEDPDPDVRLEAKRVLRVLEPRTGGD